MKIENAYIRMRNACYYTCLFRSNGIRNQTDRPTYARTFTYIEPCPRPTNRLKIQDAYASDTHVIPTIYSQNPKQSPLTIREQFKVIFSIIN